MTIIIILSMLFLLVDQISKLMVIKLININHSVTVIKNFFYLTYTKNIGAAFSILNGQRIFLIVVAILIIVLLFYYLRKNKIEGKIKKVAFSLVIGGSFGNLFDRIVRGFVVDFFDVKIFGYNFPIFNIADTFIVIGVFLLIIMMSRKEDRK